MSVDTAADSRQRGVRVLGIAFIAIFVLLCAAAIATYFGSGDPPHWTKQQERINAMSQTQREAVSENFRNHSTTEWSAVNPGTTFGDPDELIGQRRTFELPYEELNVWLAQEGVELLSAVGIHLPNSVKAAMIDSPGNGLLRISCDLDNGKVQQVVALSFKIDVAEDGTVVSSLKRATAGRLPLPTQTAIDLIAMRTGSGGRMLALMQGTPIGPIDLPIDLSEDGLRDGRLIGLEIRDDAMVITRLTVRRQRSN